MEKPIDLIENSKQVFEQQTLILKLNENLSKTQLTEYDEHQFDIDIDDTQPNFIYKNKIKFSAAIPQVNK